MIRTFRVRFTGVALGALALLGALGNNPAAAYEGHSGPVTVSVTSEGSGTAAPTLRVEAKATSGVRIYEIRAHVCGPGRNIRTSYDFGFEGGDCPNVAIGKGDVDPSAAFPVGVSEGTLDNVRIGTGAVHWVNELGYPGSIQCDATHSCDLVVRVQITDSTAFVTVPLCGVKPCAGASGGSYRFFGTVWLWLLAGAAVLVALWVAATRRRPVQAGTS